MVSFLCCCWLYPWHVEVPRLRVQSELQLPAYTTAHGNAGSEPCLWPTPQLTATPGPWPTERGQGSNPATSWLLVGFISAVPRQELPFLQFLIFLLSYVVFLIYFSSLCFPLVPSIVLKSLSGTGYVSFFRNSFYCLFFIWLGHAFLFLCMLCDFFFNWTYEKIATSLSKYWLCATKDLLELSGSVWALGSVQGEGSRPSWDFFFLSIFPRPVWMPGFQSFHIHAVFKCLSYPRSFICAPPSWASGAVVPSPPPPASFSVSVSAITQWLSQEVPTAVFHNFPHLSSRSGKAETCPSGSPRTG